MGSPRAGPAQPRAPAAGPATSGPTAAVCTERNHPMPTLSDGFAQR